MRASPHRFPDASACAWSIRATSFTPPIPTDLLIITQIQPIAVIFTLPQDQLPQVFDQIAQGAAQLAVEAYDRDNTAKIASGKLLTIDNQIDITTGTYKLKAIFNNEDNILFPNQFVNTHLLGGHQAQPQPRSLAALQRGPEAARKGTYVYRRRKTATPSKFITSPLRKPLAAPSASVTACSRAIWWLPTARTNCRTAPRSFRIRSASTGRSDQPPATSKPSAPAGNAQTPAQGKHARGAKP